MRVIIAGGRNIWSYALLEDAIKESGFDITRVVCGMAPGADSVGWAWAYTNGIPIDEFPADWLRYGNSAGPIRNAEMAKNAEALILFWDGISKGSRNMLNQARHFGLQTCEMLETDTFSLPPPRLVV